MTVTSGTSKANYTSNGVATVYSTIFAFLHNSEVQVRFGTTLQTEGIQYALTGAGTNGPGTVTIDPGYIPINAVAISILRDVPFTQPVSLHTYGPFSPSVHEALFDESVFRDQELDRRVSALETAGTPGSIVAGDGLAFALTTLNVVAGDGITVAGDEVSVVFGDSGADMNVGTVQNVANPGGLPKAARIDHAHSTLCSAPGPVQAGASASEGSSVYLARADHVHDVAIDVPVNITKATASAGVATSFAASDHKHDVTTAVALDLTDSTSAEGNATSLARSNHTHSHGSRAGGTLHAAVTQSVNGFMSAADKTKLDAHPTFGTSVIDAIVAVTTTDATPTTIQSWSPTDQSTEQVEVRVAAMRRVSQGTEGAGYFIAGTFRRKDGTLTQIGSTRIVAGPDEDTAGWDVTFNVSSPNLRVQVTGASASIVQWVASIKRVVCPAP